MMQTAVTLPALVVPPPVSLPAPDAAPDAALSTLATKLTSTLATSAPFILFGRDDAGRPHAARFAEGDADSIRRAADLMNFSFAAADTQALQTLAATLPVGRLFESGRGFVPFIKAALYERLLAATGAPDVTKAASSPDKPADGGTKGDGGSGGAPGGAGAGGPAGKATVQKFPSHWDEIGVGSHVLACQGSMEGWFEAVVLSIRADRIGFTLGWRDWPDEPEITRNRKELGLLPYHSMAGTK